MVDVKSITEAQIELMNQKQLVEAYNALAPHANQVEVKRFATRQDGIKRALRLLAVARSAIAKWELAQKSKTPAKPEIKETIASYTRNLIAAGNMKDEDILKSARDRFPDKKISSNLVSHYRKHFIVRQRVGTGA